MDTSTVCCRACFEDGRKVMEDLERKGLARKTGRRRLCRFADGDVFLDEEWEVLPGFLDAEVEEATR